MNKEKKLSKEVVKALDNIDRNSLKKKSIVIGLASGLSITAVCEDAHLSRESFYKWQKKDRKFRDAIEKEKSNRVKFVEDTLFDLAKSGNVTGIIFFLCNRAKDKWHNVNKVEHSGEVKGTITHRFADLSDEELEKIINIAEKKKKT